MLERKTKKKGREKTKENATPQKEYCEKEKENH